MTLVGLIAGIGFAAFEAVHWYTHVYEFDARIRTDMTRISSRVNGTVADIAVGEGDRVTAGDLLVTMETGMVRQRIVALKADLSGVAARREKLRAEKHALKTYIEARIATRRELVRALEVEHKALVDRQVLAGKKLKRTQFLVSRNLTSQQVLEQDQDAVLDLAGQVSVAWAKVGVAKREIAEIKAERARLAVLDEEIQMAEIDAERFEALVKEREADLSERFIRSPIDGVVDRVFKNKGEYVEDADELLILHDPDNIWIEANISEDQIRHLRIGQPVKIDLDAYPFETFRGEVVRIGMVTVADLTPAGNGATARTLKTAQRIPVKIRLLDPPELTAPGMLVEVNIQIYEKVGLP